MAHRGDPLVVAAAHELALERAERRRVARERAGPAFLDVVAALPDFLLGGAFLVTWIAPATFGERAIRYFLLLMLLEFVIMHSSAIMGNAALKRTDRRGAAKAVVGLSLFYTVFVAGIALAFRAWWPILGFWGLTANRLFGLIIGQAPSDEEKQLVQGGWAASAVSYLCFVFLTVLAPLPRLGVTPEAVNAADLPGEGLWIEQPHRVLAFGFLYFTAIAWSELHRHRWFHGTVTTR